MVSVPFTNPLVAGTTLIRTAIHSPDYVAGVSGWTINKDGTAEFNNVTVRGTLVAGGGVVIVNSDGIAVESIGGDAVYKVNRTGGFTAAFDPDNGAKIQIAEEGIFLTPEDPSPNGTNVDFAELFVGYTNAGAAGEFPYLFIGGVEYNGKNAPGLLFNGQADNDSNPDSTSNLQVITREIRIVNENLTDNHSHQYLRGENAAFTTSWSVLDAVTISVTFTHAFTIAPQVETNISSGAAAVARWGSRATSITTTGFTFFLFAAVGGSTTSGTNIPLSWVATEFTP